MTSVWQGALREAWAEIATHPVQSRQFRTRRLSSDLSLNVYAALRAADDAPCLVIHAMARAEAFFEVGGMRLGAVAGEQSPLLVLSLEDRDRLDLFTTVCGDVIDAIAEPDPLEQFLARLEAWRRFLRERRSGLSHEGTIGLLGELSVLERVLQTDSRALSTWIAPDDGLHDFQREGHSIEIKTSLGPSSTVRISALDQLDTSGLRRLDLFHVRLIEAPDGRSLADLIGDVVRLLPDESGRQAFGNALLRRGLMPDDSAARLRPRVQLRSIDAYGIDATFPKLTRATVPAEILDVTYVINVQSIAGHTTDSGSVLNAFTGTAGAA